MLSVRCAVPACSNERTPNGTKTFLPAPKQKAVRDEWFRVLGVPDTVQDAFICEDHFEVDNKPDRVAEGDASSTSSSASEPEAEPEPGNRKRKSVTESKLPYKKKVLSKHRNSNKETASDDVVRNGYSKSTTPSPRISSTGDSPQRSENSGSAWSSKEGPKFEDDDSNGSDRLVIKSEPEDEGYEKDINGEYDYSESKPPIDEGCIKIEASSIELHEERTEPFTVGHDRINGCQPRVLSHPSLEIIDQPETSYRFRYKRESMKPHGPLKGRSSVDKSPKYSHGPRVMLRNFLGTEAVIRVWLFCGKEVSPHQLVAPPDSGGSELKYEPHEVHVTSQNNFTASFDKLNILHVVCGEREYQRRYYEKKIFCASNSYHPPPRLPRFEDANIKDELKRIEKDIVRLYFEAFEKTGSGFRKICDVFSEDIKNKKSPKTNDLRILRQSHQEGSCRGNQQILILTERLIKDVNVEFFEEDEEGEITWRCSASFKETDIHKQVAITFWTPPYKDLHIKNPVPVFFRLVRKTDGAYSHNRTYRYMPDDCPCKSSKTSKTEVPKEVYLNWPRPRKCTSPDRMTFVKDIAIQTNLTFFNEAGMVRSRGYHPVTSIRSNPAPAQPARILPKPNANNHRALNSAPDSSSSKSVPKAGPYPAHPPSRPSIAVDRKIVQLPGNIVHVEGQKFLKVHIPNFVLHGVPTSPVDAAHASPPIQQTVSEHD